MDVENREHRIVLIHPGRWQLVADYFEKNAILHVDSIGKGSVTIGKMSVSDFVRELLVKRGVTAEADIESFLNPDYLAHVHAPNLLQGLDRAVARVLHAISA